jgi:hypothetical protein
MFNHHSIKRALVGGLVIAAGGLPSVAQAMVIDGGETAVPVAPPASSQPAPQSLDQVQRNVQQWFAIHGRFPSAAASTAPAATSHGDFQWGDAGIGAAGATVLLGAGALGVGATRRRRRAAIS